MANNKKEETKWCTMELLTIGWMMPDPPLPKPRQALLGTSSLWTGNEILWYGISLWSARVTCPSYAPSQFPLWTSSLAEHGTWKRVLLMSWKLIRTVYALQPAEACSVATSASQIPYSLQPRPAKCQDILPHPHHSFIVLTIHYNSRHQAQF